MKTSFNINSGCMKYMNPTDKKQKKGRPSFKSNPNKYERVKLNDISTGNFKDTINVGK